MKLTQKQAIDAYKVVRKLENQDMPGSAAMFFFMARKTLEKQFEFQNEQEQKELTKLGCSIDEKGIIKFPDDEAKLAYIQKMDEIAKIEVDVSLEKAQLDISGLRLSVKDIEALEYIAEIVC